MPDEVPILSRTYPGPSNRKRFLWYRVSFVTTILVGILGEQVGQFGTADQGDGHDGITCHLFLVRLVPAQDVFDRMLEQEACSSLFPTCQFGILRAQSKPWEGSHHQHWHFDILRLQLLNPIDCWTCFFPPHPTSTCWYSNLLQPFPACVATTSWCGAASSRSIPLESHKLPTSSARHGGAEWPGAAQDGVLLEEKVGGTVQVASALHYAHNLGIAHRVPWPFFRARECR